MGYNYSGHPMSKLRDLLAAPFMLIALTAMWIACFIHDVKEE